MLRPAKARFRGAVEVHALPNAGKEETGQILVRYEMNPELSRVARGAKLRWITRARHMCARLMNAPCPL